MCVFISTDFQRGRKFKVRKWNSAQTETVLALVIAYTKSAKLQETGVEMICAKNDIFWATP